jgi:SAM-dependent methyltransferase
MVEMRSGTSGAAAGDQRATSGDIQRVAYRRSRVAHWDAVAGVLDRLDRWNRGYHARLAELYQWAIPPGRRVLEIGCGAGDLLAGLRPVTGVGVDFSRRMLDVAERRHPDVRFILTDAHDLDLGQTFDYIILSDVINDVWDVQQVFERVRRHSEPHTRIVLNFHSHLWQLPLRLVRALGLSRPTLEQSWLTVGDVANLLDLADFEIVRHSTEVLWPLRTPGIARVCNRGLAKVWPSAWRR